MFFKQIEVKNHMKNMVDIYQSMRKRPFAVIIKEVDATAAADVLDRKKLLQILKYFLEGSLKNKL